MPRRRPLLALVLLAVLAASCTGDNDDPPPSGGSGTGAQIVNAMMASTDHYVGAPQRIGVGLVLNDGRLISYGSVDMTFTFTDDGSGTTEASAGPTATAVYLPTPGTDDTGTSPAVTQPSEGRGIYEADGVTFDRAGFWQVDVLADVEGEGTMRASTTFGVTAEPALPAPGQPALETENLTLDDHDDAPLGAVDSRAVIDGVVPDEMLHEMTIADALKAGTPAVVVFATPAFCESKFCGPVTDVIQDLAERYSDRAEFIHVEIYREYEQGNVVINQAAADWLLRNDNLTEPWIYLIGADGIIQDRWAVLIRSDDLESQLRALPKPDR